MVIIVFTCVIDNLQAQDAVYSYGIKDARGGWEHEMLDAREVISTDEKNNIATVYIDVPQEGYYQFMVSLYHRWREFCPFIHFKITDSKGSSFSEYVFSEQRHYMKEGEGRWEYRSPSAAPFWCLSRGRAEVKFWVQAKNDCWEGIDVEMEGKIFIEKFVLIPVDLKQMMHPSILDENKIAD